jgi:hypothetical protein
MQNHSVSQQNSPAWLFFVKASFVFSVLALAAGIFWVPGEPWVKGYLAMGVLYAVGSSFILSKTLRDEFESSKLMNKIEEARAEKILKEFDVVGNDA